MTISVSTFAPTTCTSHVETIKRKTELVETNISFLEAYIKKLTIEKEGLVETRHGLLSQLQTHRMHTQAAGRIPMSHIATFLAPSDMFNLMSTSKHFMNSCRSPDDKFLIVHLTSPSCDLTEIQAEHLVDSICLPAVESLFIDAKKKGSIQLMHALASKSCLMTSLTSVRISAAAETGQFISDVYAFFGGLCHGQITSIHLSGLRTMESVGLIIKDQASSIARFRVDYFVNDHEREVVSDFLPEMPNLVSLIYDVADVVDINADLVLARLSAIANKAAVERLYLPHMQIAGDCAKIQSLVSMVKQFSNASQFVLRFRQMPLSVRDIVALREALVDLPAVCISNHFIVAMNAWADWWPSLNEVWDRPDKITGLSVFREQIDFEALGTSATREWLRLSADQKRTWQCVIAPRVQQLYIQQSKKRFSPVGSMCNSLRSVSL